MAKQMSCSEDRVVSYIIIVTLKLLRFLASFENFAEIS